MNPAGLVRLFVRHRNAANLLMVLMIAIGAVSLNRLNTQFFPDFGLDIIRVGVIWPGASADDVERNIVAAIEPNVRFLNNVKRVISFAVEGRADLIIEFVAEADMQTALSEVETAVAEVLTLPEDAEAPVVRRLFRYDPILRIVLSGPFSEAALKHRAKIIRDELLEAGIDRVVLRGSRSEEIWVDVSPPAMRHLNLSIDEVATRIRGQSQDLPSGTIEGAVEQQIRSMGQETNAEGIADLEVLSFQDGRKIRLSDIADIQDAFDPNDIVQFRRGSQAVELTVQRAVTADALSEAEIAENYLKSLRSRLPPALRLEVYDIQANHIKDRINLLLRNGISGLALVVATLFLFLNARAAFWVAAGIPVALFATMAVMLVSGQSINMVSLFALIMTLGIIVDDAIVVGEHAVHQRERGLSPEQAAETGALRMLAPVTASSLTTIAAFLPILMIGGLIGSIIKAIPLVTVSILVASLIECFLVLPGHMRSALQADPAVMSRFRRWFNGHFDRFRDGVFRRFVVLAVNWRYTVVAVAVACLVLSIGVIMGGRVGFNFFPTPEADMIHGNVVMTAGTSRRVTADAIKELERAALSAERRYGEPGDLIVMTSGSIGQSGGRDMERISGDRYGGLTLELLPSDFRTVRTDTFIAAWRREIQEIPGIERISLVPRTGGPPGREIDVRLRGDDSDQLKRAANELKVLLRRLPGVSDVEDDLPFGKQELILDVTPRGRALGFDISAVGRQVRNAFEGAIAKRFARGDEEVTIKVKWPDDQRSKAALFGLYLKSPDGREVPLSEVVEIRESAGFQRIRRQDGQQEVAVVGEIDEDVTSLNEVIPALFNAGLDELAQRHAVRYAFKGKAEEQAETIADMQVGAAIGLISIYVILAWVFADYWRPVVVMLIIPFGLVGAVLGHMLLEYDLTILSLIALLGLAGILVNDSIILVSTIDEKLRGTPDAATPPIHPDQAIVEGVQARLRAVLLTSLTTIAGLMPLLFETSLQAQFLIPMAITLVFGLAVATLLVLIVVPAMLAIQHDAGRLRRWLFSPKQPSHAKIRA